MIRLNKELCVFSVFTIIEMAVIFENLLKLLEYFTQKVFRIDIIKKKLNFLMIDTYSSMLLNVRWRHMTMHSDKIFQHNENITSLDNVFMLNDDKH